MASTFISSIQKPYVSYLLPELGSWGPSLHEFPWVSFSQKGPHGFCTHIHLSYIPFHFFTSFKAPNLTNKCFVFVFVFFPTGNERWGIHSALKASIYIHDEAHLICLFLLHAITSPLTALVPWMDCVSRNLRPSSHIRSILMLLLCPQVTNRLGQRESLH